MGSPRLLADRGRNGGVGVGSAEEVPCIETAEVVAVVVGGERESDKDGSESRDRRVELDVMVGGVGKEESEGSSWNWGDVCGSGDGLRVPARRRLRRSS